MVDLALNEEQRLLRQAVRDFLSESAPVDVVREIEASQSGISVRLWQRMAELEWIGLPLPATVGGADADLFDVAILAEELGRAAVPTPYPCAVLAGLTLCETGRQDLLDSLRLIIHGETIATWAFLDGHGRSGSNSSSLEAKRDGQNYRLFGRRSFVPYGHAAKLLVCPARLPDCRLGVFLVNGSNVRSRQMSVLGGDRLADLIFDGVPARPEALLADSEQAKAVVNTNWNRSVALKCAEMVGGIHRVLEMTVGYAKARVQFGRPIGSFQAVQHLCADMALLATAARLVTYEATSKLAAGKVTSREVSIAKVFTGEAYTRVVSNAAQIHGGVGFMVDHDLPFYFRNAKASETLFGTPEEHLERIAASLET